jgi:hypothetical protein
MLLMWVKRVVTLKIRFILSYVTAILNSVTVVVRRVNGFRKHPQVLKTLGVNEWPLLWIWTSRKLNWKP